MSTTPTRRAAAAATTDAAAVQKALSSTPRPPRATPMAATLTFGWRGMLKVKHVPEQRPEAERVLERALETVHLEADPAALSAACADADRAAEAVAELSRSGVRIADFSLGQPSLDEVFLALTGHPAEDQDDDEAISSEREQAA